MTSSNSYEQDIYDKYGSQEYRARTQRECAAFNCPTWVSHPDEEFCSEHQYSPEDEREAIRRSLEISEEADVEPGDRVEWRGREWEFTEYLEWHHVALEADDGTIKQGVDVRDLDPVGGEADGE